MRALADCNVELDGLARSHEIERGTLAYRIGSKPAQVRCQMLRRALGAGADPRRKG